MSNCQKAGADGARLLGEAVEISDGVFAYVQPDGISCINNTGVLTVEDRIPVHVDDLVCEVCNVCTRAQSLIDAAGDGE